MDTGVNTAAAEAVAEAKAAMALKKTVVDEDAVDTAVRGNGTAMTAVVNRATKTSYRKSF